MKQFEALEGGRLEGLHFEMPKKMALVNPFFKTEIAPKDGLYTALGIVKREGLRTDGLRNYVKKLAVEGKLRPNRDISLNSENQIAVGKGELRPWEMRQEDNMTHVADSHGRVIAAKITDINPDANGGGSRAGNVIDELSGDEKGHIIANQFGGKGDSAHSYNLAAQNKKINQGDYKTVEKFIRNRLKHGEKVDYEVRVHYDDKTKRPSSYTFKVTINGEEVDLAEAMGKQDAESEHRPVTKSDIQKYKHLKKIYNNPEITRKGKIVTTLKETAQVAKEVGKEANGVSVKNAELAAKMTFVTSTVKYSKQCLQGEISPGEMAEGIVADTAKAGLGAYGTSFITQSASAVMRRSSIELINKVGGSCAPAMAVSFAVSSYDSVTQFAKGEIDGKELAYNLGNNAVSLAGSTAGGVLTAVAIGAVGVTAGPVAAAAGILGGVIGCAVSTEVYASAVELGTKGAEIVAEKAKGLAKDTTSFFEDQFPDKVSDVKAAFNDYFAEHKLGIQI